MDIRKKILITGASRGIGSAVALRLAADGHEVGIHYGSSEAAARDVAGQVRSQGGVAHLFQADFDDPEQAARLGYMAWETMGGIDVLINNAGVSYKREALAATLADMQHFMRVNYLATVMLTQAVAERQVAAGTRGSIFSMTSVNAIQPGKGLSAYGASKSALETYMKGAAVELASHGIRVNTLVVGAIQTDMNEEVWRDPIRLETVEKRIPLGRLGQTEEVAALVAALVLADAYLTGTSIRIDGGWLNGNH